MKHWLFVSVLTWIPHQCTALAAQDSSRPSDRLWSVTDHQPPSTLSISWHHAVHLSISLSYLHSSDVLLSLFNTTPTLLYICSAVTQSKLHQCCNQSQGLSRRLSLRHASRQVAVIHKTPRRTVEVWRHSQLRTIYLVLWETSMPNEIKNNLARLSFSPHQDRR